MATITPIREDGSTIKPIPVCNRDGHILYRVDTAGALFLEQAENAAVVRARKHGAIVRLILDSAGDDSAVKKLNGDPRKYTYLECSDAMPQGVHTLRYLPKSTKALYCLSVTDCLAA